MASHWGSRRGTQCRKTRPNLFPINQKTKAKSLEKSVCVYAQGCRTKSLGKKWFCERKGHRLFNDSQYEFPFRRNCSIFFRFRFDRGCFIFSCEIVRRWRMSFIDYHMNGGRQWHVEKSIIEDAPSMSCRLYWDIVRYFSSVLAFVIKNI